MEGDAHRLLVVSNDDVLATKLLASEPTPSFRSVFKRARALREQIDWEDVRSRSTDFPFERAFFTLVEELGIVESVRSAAA